jgi:predicted RNase H-like HicB family nuclease
METKRFIYCEEDGKFVGWFEEYPEYHTQGETLDELRAHLLDLHKDIVFGGTSSRC